MSRPARLLPVVFTALLLLAARATAQTPSDTAEDEKLLKDAGYKLDAADLLDFFCKRTFGAEDQQRAAKLAGQLGDDRFEVRENASRELIKLGSLARPYLREALSNKDAEVERRALFCLDTIDGGPEPALVGAAARLLATKAQPDAAAVVMNYLHWTPNDDVQDEVVLALLKIVEREGSIDAVVAAALTDQSASRRAAAALAVGRSGTAEQRKDVRKLLADPETKVRLRAAQGLIAGHDKDAIPALIELLAQAEFGPSAEDLLMRIAGDKTPKVALGETDETRHQCREAWEAWWKANGDIVTLERAEVDPLVYDAPRRATDVATRWTAALMKGDTATIRRLTAYPFSFVSRQEFNADQLDQWINGAKGALTFKDPRLVDGPRLLKSASPQERKRVEGIPPRDLYAVCFTYREGRGDDYLYVIVRFKGGEGRVLGLGLGDLK